MSRIILAFLLFTVSALVRAELVIEINCSRAADTGGLPRCPDDPPDKTPQPAYTNGGHGVAPLGASVPTLSFCRMLDTTWDCTNMPVGGGDAGYPSAPTGWTTPTTPPTTATVSSVYSIPNCPGTYTSGQAACSAAAATNCQNLGTYGNYSGGACKNAAGQVGSGVSITSSCPSGYTLSGSVCTLTNASAAKWPSDGTCTPARVGNAFSDNPRDPDCTGSNPAVPPSYTRSGDGTTITGTDPASKGTAATVKINADGSITVTNTRPNSDGSTSTVSTGGISAPPGTGSGTGKVSGVSDGTINGTGTQTGTGGTQFDKSGLATEAGQGTGNALLQGIKDNLEKQEGTGSSSYQFPAVKSDDFYKTKYENGMTGIWDDFKADLQASNLSQAIEGFRISASGGCPSFQLDLGPMFGTGDISPPCWVFDAIGAVMLVTALFTCRAIIFGG